jgi:anaerobic magnesium-protoporphyrin IX monomethyl ester cyclase
VKVLFVVADLYFSEPLGAMILSGVCKAADHETSLVVLQEGNILEKLNDFRPDLVAYSTMTPDEGLFVRNDQLVQQWAKENKADLKRIMGGPHPTFFPQVMQKMSLDAICAGDGENAIISVIDAIGAGLPLEGIKNVSTPLQPAFEKEIVEDMNAVAFADRDLLYDADPTMLKHGIRSFLTQKGCPYKCTYCFNHAYNRMFKGEGRKILRRRSVDDLIEEIKLVVENYPKCRYVRFSDDVFVIEKDDWLVEFAEKYPKEIGIPFYCLIRSNSLTEEVAQLLSIAGCKSVSMSIEAGDEKIRNDILKRNMPNEMLETSFALARKYGINVFGNSILAVPGTTFEDDYRTFLFARKLRPAAPTFSIFSPFPMTDLTNYAHQLGVLDKDFDFNDVSAWDRSMLNNISDKDKDKQTRLAYLGMTFCKLPDFMLPVLNLLLLLPLTGLYRFIGSFMMAYALSVKIFPGAHPRDPLSILQAVWRALTYMMRPSGSGKENKGSGAQSPGAGLASPDY